MTSCIYLLSVGGKPRYVGQTHSLEDRAERHRHTIEFVADLFDLELPRWDLQVLEEVSGRFALNAAERKWITKMVPQGICNRQLPIAALQAKEKMPR